jgi:hypothetical protein
MKNFTIVLMTLFSLSSFANQVKCEIFKTENGGDATKIETILLGDIAPDQQINEEKREITKLNGIVVSVQLISELIAITVSKKVDENAEKMENILEAGGFAQGIFLSLPKENLGIICSSEK